LSSDEIEIKGFCPPRFAAVKNAFEKNFREGKEIGASCAVTIDGEFVIDIWAGYADADNSRLWEKDTIVNVWSTTKVMTALCAHLLVDRGLLDLNAPVAKYWTEFAQAGKEKLPVKFLLSHMSGMAGWDRQFSIEDLYKWDYMCRLLAEQAPWWEPGTCAGYHAISFGYLIGEIVRRITGSSLGTFFQKEIAGPLKADFHIGLPAAFDSRVAELITYPSPIHGDANYVDPEWVKQHFPINAKVFLNSPPITEEVTGSRQWRAAEIPSTNGHGNARSVARVASVLACGGKVGNSRLLSQKTIEKSLEEQFHGTDLALMLPISWGLGWGLNCPERWVSPNPRSFYWSGAGGSVVVMDLDARLSYAYVMNKMEPGVSIKSRSKKINEALYASL